MTTELQPTIRRTSRPFRRAVLRGLGVVLPPLLTIVIFIWAWNTIHIYVLDPLTRQARNVLALYMADVRYDLAGPTAVADGKEYTRLANESYIPSDVHEMVRASLGQQPMPESAQQVYRRYVELSYLRPHLVIPVFIVVFVVSMYLLGTFLAAGFGRFLWNLLERGIQRLPLVRSVYSSVKQVTDLMVNESEVRFTRVVAVEYPRKGTWSIGMVTSESLLDIRATAGEPVLAVLIPFSPLPITGTVVTVLKSETIDLNMTLDQAIQFIVSCGVVVPPHQLPSRERAAINASV